MTHLLAQMIMAIVGAGATSGYLDTVDMANVTELRRIDW
jgi:hypothetical protein